MFYKIISSIAAIRTDNDNDEVDGLQTSAYILMK